MGHKVRAKKKAPITRVIEAKKAVNAATRRAKAVHDDTSRDRSTRTRSAYKIKADALDRVGEILEG